MSRLLREDAPNSLRYISLWCTEPWTWEAWPKLDEAVRSGRNVFPELFGKEVFGYLHTDRGGPAKGLHKAVPTPHRQAAQDCAGYLELTGIAAVVDMGGGQGHVLASLLEKHPALHGTLLDLPKVVAGADSRLQDGGAFSARARMVPGDCRVDIPVRADL